MSHDPEAPTVAIGEDATVSADTGDPARAGRPRGVGRYVLGEQLGAGGMGVVYRARDPDLGRELAIKVVRPRHAGTDGRARLLREAQALARLRHRAVVPVFDVGTTGDDVFVVMPLLEGGTLGAWARATPRPWQDVIDRYLVAGEGLAAAHAAGLIHRDFKPDNVLIGADGEIQVADFGLARMADDDAVAVAEVTSGDATLTQTGAVLGTPAYMPPEQLRGAALDARSDQFSFCTAVWEALHGVRPFAAPAPDVTNAIDLRVRTIASGEMAEPRAATVPPRLRAILRRGLAADPADRWPDMATLLRELRRLRAPRRWPIAAGVIAVAAIGAAGVALALDDDAPPRTPAPPPAPSGPTARVTDWPVRLTTDPGCEEFPSLTPDGKTVLYDGRVPGGSAIFALDLETRASTRLTFHEGSSDLAPSVSPDGTQFAFVRTAPRSSAHVAPIGDGRAARELIVGGVRPAWSRDGKHLWVGKVAQPSRVVAATGEVVAQVAPPEATRAYYGVETPTGELFTTLFAETGQGMGLAILAPGAAPRHLASGQYEEALAPLPGDRALLASRVTIGGRPVVMHVGFDGTITELALGEVQPYKGLAVTKDGKRAVWSDCHAEMDLVALVGDRVEPLTGGRWEDRDVTAVPGTSLVVVASDRTGAPLLWVVDPSGATPPRQLPHQSVRATGIAVSPDAAWVVFSGGGADAGGEGLLAVPFDGRAPERTLTTSAADSSPAIGADGFVYFDRQIDAERWDVMRVPLAGGEVETVIERADTPKASQDGALLLYLQAGKAMIRELATGKDSLLSKELAVGAFLRGAFSPDGRRVGLINNTQLHVVDRTTGEIVQRFETSAEQLTGVAFAGERVILNRLVWIGDLWTAGIEVTGG